MSTTTLKITSDKCQQSLMVRCDLTQASSGIEVNWMSERDSEFEPTQWQTADARHSSSGLAKIGTSLLAEALESSVEDLGEIEVEDITAHLAMIELLTRHGDRFAGNAPGDIATEWIDNDFDAESADGWMDIGVWEPSTAALLRDADLTPAAVKSAADDLEDAEEYADDVYTSGSVIYSICNSDTSIDVLLAACAAK